MGEKKKFTCLPARTESMWNCRSLETNPAVSLGTERLISLVVAIEPGRRKRTVATVPPPRWLRLRRQLRLGEREYGM